MNVTYSGLNLTEPIISVHQAPIAIEHSAQNLTNGTEGIDTFPYRVQTYLRINSFEKGNLTDFAADAATVNNLDGFTNHLVWGPNGTAAADLFGVANRQRLIDAVSDQYARYMCLVIDMRLRQTIGVDARAKIPGDEGFLEGTAYVFSSRLQINRISKITMQTMLGVMILFGACTHLFADLRGTLPRKPTSIASRMALLAGSDLCNERKALLPRGAIWKSEKELGKLFDGWVFSLGWWQQSGTSDDEGVNVNDENCQNDQGERDVFAEETGSGTAKRRRHERFGVDVGVPEQLGFRETKWSVLRKRLARQGNN